MLCPSNARRLQGYQARVFDSLTQAIAEYEQAVQAQPNYPVAQYHLALAYHTQAKLQADDPESGPRTAGT